MLCCWDSHRDARTVPDLHYPSARVCEMPDHAPASNISLAPRRYQYYSAHRRRKSLTSAVGSEFSMYAAHDSTTHGHLLGTNRTSTISGSGLENGR